MTSSELCPICKEGLWLQFLKKITLIDGVTYSCSGSMYKFTLKAIPLAGLRPDDKRIDGEKYFVRWYHDGVHLADHDNQFEFARSRENSQGDWRVQLEFKTPEVRADPMGLLISEENFSIGEYEKCTGIQTVAKSW
jgi:hypothetical protein